MLLAWWRCTTQGGAEEPRPTVREESPHGHLRSPTAGCSPEGHQGSACSLPSHLLLRDDLRLLVDRVGAVGARRGWRQCAPACIERSVGGGDGEVVTRWWHPCRTDPLCVHHDSHDRGEGGCAPPARPVGVVAGGGSGGPVRPPGCPPDHAFRHDGLLDESAQPWGPRRSF